MQVKRVHVLAAILVVLAAYFLWCKYGGPEPVSTRHYTTAPTPRQLAGVPTHTVTGAKVKVYDRDQAKRKLGVSDEEIEDGEEIQNAAEIPPSPAGVKAVVFVNTTTGKSRISYKANERPLFSFEKGTEIGVRYGVTTRGGQAATVFVRRDLARIGRVYVSGYGEVNAPVGGADPRARPEAKGMIEATGRFWNVPGLE